MRPAVACPNLPLVFALQETTSCDFENRCTWLHNFGCKGGSAALVVSSASCNEERSWCNDASNSAKNFKEYEKFMQMLKRVLLAGRREGAQRYFVRGDLKVELELLCMEDDDMKINGIEADPGCLKKAMWLEIFTEFNYRALSTCMSCDDRRENAWTHKSLRTDVAVGLHFGSKERARGCATFTMRQTYAVHGITTLVHARIRNEDQRVQQKK